ncbi:MAG: hypothetical protein COZ12_01520 [Deltaproteobacteria bacterium CG_4_10_14_3_um_filter_60_8]|nr:MAG: hypothetical protein AUK28_06440 [Desulfobacterales bacterium CG2_30_60_27]PIY23987.1 MAG: hypothetical protein COZ12_01520 [Deltaproteobacteria bacterium CG_4_10_14_3_um_filter_60_8]
MAVGKKLLGRLLPCVVPPLYRLVSWLLFNSCRVEKVGLEKLHPNGDAHCIMAFWHYSVFYTLHLCRGMSAVAMVSGSTDGEYVARLLHALGIATVRGSRGKGGLAALKKMAAAMAQGRSGAIVADGSQGPPLIVQAGAILLASRTGQAIVPIAWSANRYFTFNSWDRTILPRPFARLFLICGAPMRVPAELRKDDIERYRLQLEERLLAIYRQAWERFGREGH